VHDPGAADLRGDVAKACARASAVLRDVGLGPRARGAGHDHAIDPELLRGPMARLYLLAATLNAWVLVLVLAAAFAVQLILGEPPCPLCVMQRFALMLCGLGPLYVLMRARDGAVSARDVAIGNGIAIVSALLGAVTSTRQVLLHILPSDAGFGSPVL